MVFPASPGPVSRPQRREGLLIAGVLALLTALLWLPFGFRLLPNTDYLRIYASLDAGNGPERLFAPSLRPLETVFHPLLYALSPDSFISTHLFLMFLLWSQALLIYILLRDLLPDNRLLPAAVALLSLASPVDAGTFYFSAIHIRATVVIYLISVYCLMRAWRGRTALWLTAGIGLSLMNLAIYEAAYPLAFLAPGMLLWLNRGRLTRHLCQMGGWWLLAHGLAFGFYLWQLLGGGNYQTPILQHSLATNTTGTILEAVQAWYGRVLFSGWIPSDTAYLPLALAGGVLTLVTMLWFRGKDLSSISVSHGAARCAPTTLSTPNSMRENVSPPRIRGQVGGGVFLFLVGLLIIGAGFAIYLVSAEHRFSIIRTLYYSAIGGTIAFAGIAYTLDVFLRLRHYLFIGFMAVIVTIGLNNLLALHDAGVREADNARRFLTQITETIPQMQPDTLLLFVVDAQRYPLPYPPDLLNAALAYLYDNSLRLVNVEVLKSCVFDMNDPTKNLSFIYACEVKNDGIFIGNAMTGAPVGTVPYRQTVVLNVYPSGYLEVQNEFPAALLPDHIPVTDYQPEARILRDAPPPSRLVTASGGPLLPAWGQTAPLSNMPLIVSLTPAVAVNPVPDTPWPIEIVNGDALLWLGENQPEGLAFEVWAETDTLALLMMNVSAGPAREDDRRTMELTAIHQHTIRQWQRPFEKNAALSFPVFLNAGRTRLILSATDSATRPIPGDLRQLLVSVQQIRLDRLEHAWGTAVPPVIVNVPGVWLNPRLRTAEWGLETAGDDAYLWLGQGAAQGLTLELWSDTEQFIVVDCRVSPGPARTDAPRTLALRLEPENQPAESRQQHFTENSLVTYRLTLPAGYSVLSLAIEEAANTPVSGDMRPLLALLDSVLIRAEAQNGSQ